MQPAPLPDTTSPSEWLEEVKQLRAEVIADAAAVLDQHTIPPAAAGGLQDVLDRFEHLTIERQLAEEVGDGTISVRVQSTADALVVETATDRANQVLKWTQGRYWWFVDAAPPPPGQTIPEVHREVARRMVAMLPWGNDDELLEMAAIEMASRAG